MTAKPELLQARATLMKRCNNFFSNLYSERDFAEFRVFVLEDLHWAKVALREVELKNKQSLPEFRKSADEHKNRIEKIEAYLQEQNDLQLVINCFDDDCISFEYFYWKAAAELPKIKTLKKLLDCFTFDDTQEITTEIAEQQIRKFAEVFLEEKQNFKFDSVMQKFFEAIGHILASVLTFGLYTIGQISYSYNKKNSCMFWKSEPELLQDELDNAMQALSATQ